MSILGELLVQINGDNSGLTKSLDNSTKATESSVNSIISTVATAAVAWKAVGIAIDGIKYNAMKEQAEIAFGVFLGSADAAKAKIKELQQVAIDTPLEFKDVRDAGKQLLAYGISASALVPTIKMLTDVSAGLNVPIQDLAYLYGTIQTQGRAMTIDINQFANRGIPIWEALANVTGKSGTALRNMVEQGQIGFPLIQQAFQNMTSEGGKFYQMSIKQMDSLIGVESNLNDAFSIYIASATSGMTGPLKTAMTDITATMNKNQKTVAALGDTFGVVFDGAAVTAEILFKGLNLIPGELTAIGIAAGIAFAFTGPVGAAIAAIVVSVGAVGKILGDMNTANVDKLRSKFLGIAESSKMTADQSAKFLDTAGWIETSLASQDFSGKNIAASIKSISDYTKLTQTQVANIAINSDKTNAAQKAAAEQFLKQNGLTKIGVDNSETRKALDDKQIEDGKAMDAAYAARYPKEAAAFAARAAADKKAQEDAKSVIELKASELVKQQGLSKAIDAINAMVAAGVITETDGLDRKIKLRNDYIGKLQDEGQQGKENLTFVISETKRINGLNNDNLTSLAAINDREKQNGVYTDAFRLKKLDLLETLDKQQVVTDEIGVSEDRFPQRTKDQNLAKLRQVEILGSIADGSAAVEKKEQSITAIVKSLAADPAWAKIKAASTDWAGRTSDIADALSGVAKTGLEDIGAHLVNGADLWSSFESAGVKALAKIVEGYGDQLAAIAAVDFATGNWVGAIAAGAGSVAAFVAGGALNAYADQLTAVDKSAKTTAASVVQTATATDLLSEAVKRARNALSQTSDTSAMTAQIAAQVDALKAKYAGLAQAARDAATAQAGGNDAADAAHIHNADMRGKTLDEAITRYQYLISIANNKTTKMFDQMDLDYLVARKAAIADALSVDPLAALNTQMQADIDAVGYNLALFQDRAAQAGDSISKSFTSGLEAGTSQADFSKSIGDMLKNMTIEAAVLAGGYADKFKAIGNQIAAGLATGLTGADLTSIRDQISTLYGQAQTSVGTINDLFAGIPGFASGTMSAPGGLSIVGENGPELLNIPRGSQVVPSTVTSNIIKGDFSQSGKPNVNVTIQSNAPLDPIQAAWHVKNTMESLAFQGVI